jgi:hypothetical protein
VTFHAYDMTHYVANRYILPPDLECKCHVLQSHNVDMKTLDSTRIYICVYTHTHTHTQILSEKDHTQEKKKIGHQPLHDYYRNPKPANFHSF